MNFRTLSETRDIAEIARAKSTILTYMKTPKWDEYWDDLCHMSINGFAFDAYNISKYIKSLIEN